MLDREDSKLSNLRRRAAPKGHKNLPADRKNRYLPDCTRDHKGFGR
jgi:hypothetical protein